MRERASAQDPPRERLQYSRSKFPTRRWLSKTPLQPTRQGTQARQCPTVCDCAWEARQTNSRGVRAIGRLG